MRFQILATDYAGTVASDGVVDDATLTARLELGVSAHEVVEVEDT